MITIQCDRCKKELKDAFYDGECTAGYYDTTASESPWAKFSEPNENQVCDDCMHSDPRYQAVYGMLTKQDVKEIATAFNNTLLKVVEHD